MPRMTVRETGATGVIDPGAAKLPGSSWSPVCSCRRVRGYGLAGAVFRIGDVICEVTQALISCIVPLLVGNCTQIFGCSVVRRL